MNIAILSGKGGTGKTTVSTNLSLALKANYIDSDVEEPNGFLFLNPSTLDEKKVYVEYPEIDKIKCTVCGECVKICNFNALAKVKDNILVFNNLCHGCGACQMVCKYDAIDYKQREIGKVEWGKSYNMELSRGVLNIGEPMAVPVIKELLNAVKNYNINIIDCPPGTSCNVVNVLKHTDFALLVTEPSQFGLHDLKMAVELVRMFNIPYGIVINKDDGKDNIITRYCKDENIKIYGKIPYNKDIARLYSKAEILYLHDEYKKIFDAIAKDIKGVLNWN